MRQPLDAEQLAEEERALKHGRTARLCPRCTTAPLYRVRLPQRLRVLRMVGVDVGRYKCRQCGNSFTLRRRTP